MILETAVGTAITEFLRPYFVRIFMRRKNDREAIAEMKRNMPTFETVGELREILNAFADDNPTMGSTFKYPTIQIVDWMGKGRICFGSSSEPMRISNEK